MDSKKKTILNGLFLITLFSVTIYTIFGGKDLSLVLEQLGTVDVWFLILGVLMVVFYVCLEATIIKYLLHVVKIEWPLHTCVRYSFIGFFYNLITPGSLGGQPAQIYYMKKEGLEIPTSTIVLMVVTIAYKFILVFIGVGILAFGQSILLALPPFALMCFYIGLFLNICCVSFMSFLVFYPNLSRYLMNKLYHILAFFHIIHNIDKHLLKLEHSMDDYHAASIFLRKNKIAIFNVFLITLFQRIILFLVTYIVLCGFGLFHYNVFDVTIMQSIISISVEMLPLPGGMGISEELFRQIFTPLFGQEHITLSVLLVSRGISYYALVAISGLVTFYCHLTIGRVKSKKGRTT